ncbi:MAG: pilus (MSHA type) biogenesis protein MshL [Pseudomonadota bacterium]|nr:pilus (MSHA type) biogenesis protein MshL [Pseudomonadota bacterium]
MNRNACINTVKLFAAVLLLSACQIMPQKDTPTMPSIQESLQDAEAQQQFKAVQPPPEVQRALLPPASSTLGVMKPEVPTFDVSVNEAPARQFFMSLVDGTADNMVVHPDVSGTLTLDLKNVSTEDVMATLRDVYGYEYRYSHGVYQVYPSRMRSQVFKVNYLDIERRGSSRTRVSSGQITQSPANSGDGGNSSDNNSNSSSGSSTAGNNANNPGQNSFSGAQITTRSEANFWLDLDTSLKMIIGEEKRRKVVINPMSDTVLVKAMPRELLDVKQYLDILQDSASRQVIIEAKILEVELNDAFQTGVNWNALIDFGGNYQTKIGQVGGGTIFQDGVSELAGTIVPLKNLALTNGAPAFGGVFALQAHLGDFNTLIELLKTQGDVQVLSSPRVSTINNQKAIIKVGTDEYFVTDIDVETDIAVGVSNQSADVTLTPFFSGVALDVTPQIDSDGRITLHVHPAISQVVEDKKDLGVVTSSSSDDDGISRSTRVPLAKSTIRETDTIVQAENGQVVVIGGLMQELVRDEVASTPFFGDLPVLGHMFRHTRKTSTKTELVILLRPVVVSSNRVWEQQIQQTTQRFRAIQHPDYP